jgi:hypothetical protein
LKIKKNNKKKSSIEKGHNQQQKNYFNSRRAITVLDKQVEKIPKESVKEQKRDKLVQRSRVYLTGSEDKFSIEISQGNKNVIIIAVNMRRNDEVHILSKTRDTSKVSFL